MTKDVCRAAYVLCYTSLVQVAYFNNYLSDPKRPQLPEHPSNKLGGGVPRGGGGFMPPANFMAGPPHAMMGYNAPRPPFYPGQFSRCLLRCCSDFYGYGYDNGEGCLNNHIIIVVLLYDLFKDLLAKYILDRQGIFDDDKRDYSDDDDENGNKWK